MTSGRPERDECERILRQISRLVIARHIEAEERVDFKHISSIILSGVFPDYIPRDLQKRMRDKCGSLQDYVRPASDQRTKIDLDIAGWVEDIAINELKRSRKRIIHP